ncbi:MAG: DEAD/DEAH box helicase [Akkermansia muciniphila]
MLYPFGRVIMNPSLRRVLDLIRTNSQSESDKGTRFEHLMKRYLETDPVYRDRFSHVWRWVDWPYRGGLADQGVDLVAQEASTGEYVAIQCKCYEETHTLSLADVGTFFTTLGMLWNTEQGTLSFARGIIIATTDRWNDKLLNTMDKQARPCQRIALSNLEEAGIDWDSAAAGELRAVTHYAPRPQQRDAIDDVLRGFEQGDRGRLIMACGTGKTFTSLRLAEELTDGTGCLLFLVPSISLLSQALRSWMEQAKKPMHAIAVCSDAKAAQLAKDDEQDLTADNLPAPACTDPTSVAKQYAYWQQRGGLIVVFSTYQSLQVVSEAQKLGGLPEFDLIICDEAHRTAGVALRNAGGGYDESQFVLVHSNDNVRGKKRLYMTATPRIYGETGKKRAEAADAWLASMDDETIYGPEFHRLPFSKAVREGLLADYKVLVLCVDEDYVREKFSTMLRENGGEYELEDMVKLLGCYNGLRKRVLHSSAASGEEWDFLDKNPMKRAVAFAGRIAVSKKVKKAFEQMLDALRESGDFLECGIEHVDGTMNAQRRNESLAWLKNEEGAEECRVLTNARCLSEGVDVPALDAVMFLAPMRSQIDIVQAVGRVMRTAAGKKYGYILLPIGVPRDKKPEEVLGDRESKYATVWDVLQALRAHDDRFNAQINKIELNRKPADTVRVVGVAGGNGGEGDGEGGSAAGLGAAEQTTEELFRALPLWQEAIFARIVKKCGSRRYWEDWAKDIAHIAERQIATITDLLQAGHGEQEFEQFLKGLHNSINPSVSRTQAIEMLAQQVITRPVFDALFENYRFAELNPVSQTMNAMLQLVQDSMAPDDARQLKNFYDSVRERTQGIDNAAGRQKVITELYDKFFKNAFPKMAEALGIVYTPVEIVDYIVRSVHAILQKEFDVQEGLGAHGVKILDPFTGTGTFIVRLLQSGLIKKRDLEYKFKNDLFASEIVLLAYYIACVNIEETYHECAGKSTYTPFDGICLTDTFRMDATGKNMLAEMFSDNARRVKRVVENDIKVIIGNPPYSVGQRSANDNNQNEDYPDLDARVAETYAAGTKATNKNSLYDSYIRAFRWASDRVQGDGVIGFVTNGGIIDKNAMNGFRRCLLEEFAAVYCFNLRGFVRGKSGLEAKKEGGNVFNIMTGVCITLLVKKKDHKGLGRLFYRDIGDYLSREQKLNCIKSFRDMTSTDWEELQMDEHGDWLNHRDPGFAQFIPLGDKECKGDKNAQAVFLIFSNGLKTQRDSWCYQYSRSMLEKNMRKSIDFFNENSGREDVVYDATCISWTRDTLKKALRGDKSVFSKNAIRHALYRPFCRQFLYMDRVWNDQQYQQNKLFPTENTENFIICISSPGDRKSFSVLISNVICDLHLADTTQCFPLYWYEKRDKEENSLDLDLGEREGDYIRHQGITDYALKQFRTVYGDPKISREDIFYYVYGLLHSPEYRERFGADLKKMLPRIPYAKDFRAFEKAGRKLADLHLHYERAVPCALVQEEGSAASLRVDKLRFLDKKTKDTIIYNRTLSLTHIPAKAYEYQVNGKSALEWVVERYSVTTDKASGIVNDPNLWCDEHNEPRYIVDLIKRVVTVSLETVDIVRSLPPLQELN